MRLGRHFLASLAGAVCLMLAVAPAAAGAGPAGGPKGRSLDPVGRYRDKLNDMLKDAVGAANRCTTAPNPVAQNTAFNSAQSHLDKMLETVREFERIYGSEHGDTVAKFRVGYQKGREKVNEKCAAVYEQKLAAARAPQNVYKGGDRKKWEEKALVKFKAAYPEAQVLGVRFDWETWAKRKDKVWNDAIGQWQFYDEETLRICIVAKASDRIATIYEVYARKDHTQGSESLGDAIRGDDLLLANFK